MVVNRRSPSSYRAPALKYEFILSQPSARYLVAKRVFDVIVASLALIVALPVLLVVSLAVITSGMPILFRQVRLGENGRSFTVIKFRTMKVSADPYAPKPELAAAMVTRVGRVLRLTGLDEVPQLLNVLRGQMSLVGPRPEMPFIVDSYDWVQRLRLNARPGVTGLWQLSPVRLKPIHQHVEYDLFYLAHRSLLLDLWIIFRTPVVLLLGRHVSLDRRLIERWEDRALGEETAAHRIVLDLSTPVATLAEVGGSS